jgi:hypothetical protein
LKKPLPCQQTAASKLLALEQCADNQQTEATSKPADPPCAALLVSQSLSNPREALVLSVVLTSPCPDSIMFKHLKTRCFGAKAESFQT